jgi:hypothetical protein
LISQTLTSPDRPGLDDPRGRVGAAKNRDRVAAEISPEQLEQAQKQAREWRPKTAAASEGAGLAHT